MNRTEPALRLAGVLYKKGMFKNGVNSDNDLALVERIRSGDCEAEESLFRRYREKIRTYLYYNIASFPSVRNDPTILEDIVQDICFGALASFRKGLYNPASGAVSTYIYRIARNKLIDSANKVLKNQAFSLPNEDKENTPEQAVVMPVNPDQSDHERLRMEAVEECLKHINVVCRQALYYRYYEELSIPAITEKLNLTPAQVSSRISDGLKAFRKNWKKIIKTHPYSDYLYE